MKQLLLSIILIAVISTTAFAYSGGSGTQASPYRISTVADWQQLKNTSSHWNKYFILIADVNLKNVSLTPVGNDTTNFTGVFDGGGHIIRNATINLPSSSNVGLFGYIGGGQIKNLGIVNINITGQDNVGGLVGYSSSSISNCYSTGAVSGGSDFVGGLVGYSSSSISNCYSTSAVSGSSYVGGLAGAGGGLISNCYSTGAVSGSDSYDVGGLVGEGFVSGSFWDVQTSGQNISNDGTGLPTLVMQSLDTYLQTFWDFKGEMRNGIADTWTMPSGGGYPVLTWQTTASPLANDEMAGAITVTVGTAVNSTTVGATGLDLTANGYNDCLDVWYMLTPTQSGKYTIQISSSNFDTTLGVFDATQKEIVFNDDSFGGKSVVILKAAAGRHYYVRVAGYDAQTGNFTLLATQGAIAAIQGDLNYDGSVNLTDFAIFAQNWLVGN